MTRTVIRLPPSQAGGKLLSGMVTVGGRSATGAILVPSALTVGPVNPPVTVPQLDGGAPAKGVSVQQVTRPRTKKKAPMVRAMAIPQKIICPIDSEKRPSLMFFREFILFIEA